MEKRTKTLSQLPAILRARPKPRCPSCNKWNRVYLTGGSFLSHCVHCREPLDFQPPFATWAAIVLAAAVVVFGLVVPLLT